MKKIKVITLLLGATLFTGLGTTSLLANDAKCGAGKCGGAKSSKSAGKCGAGKKEMVKKSAGKCGADKKEMVKKSAGKCGTDKKEAPKKAGKCGVGKCG
ncbi:MAG: hypothetical protein L3J19_09505 [Sulfurimonas sp.]|nr:hypothetical protein [Sulfurimonas sp.]